MSLPEPAAPTRWSVSHRSGTGGELFGVDLLAAPVSPMICVQKVRAPTIVLGSAQPDEVVDPPACRAAGVDVVRRRSGGGAVWLDAASVDWIDVVVPSGDRLWSADVGEAFHWLGDAIARVLFRSGSGDVAVHRGAMVTSPWSALVYFAGLGPGEVTVGGMKAVGVSQKRTRAGALFQVGILRRWDPSPLLACLALSPDDRARAYEELRGACTVVPESTSLDVVVAAISAC